MSSSTYPLYYFDLKKGISWEDKGCGCHVCIEMCLVSGQIISSHGHKVSTGRSVCGWTGELSILFKRHDATEVFSDTYHTV